MSFQEVMGFSNEWVFLGFDNYKEAISDPGLKIAFKNAFEYAFLSIVTQIPIAFLLAMILTSSVLRKTKDLYRVLFYVPVVIPGVTIALIGSWFFNDSRGMANEINLLFGGQNRINWLMLPKYIMTIMVTLNFWKSVGFHAVFLMAGLSGIDATIIEASKVDGANSWQRIIFIFIPMLKSVFAYITIVAFSGSLMVFDIPFTLFQGRAGPGGQGWFPMTYIVDQTLMQHRLGFASAIGWILFVIAGVLTFAQLKFYDTKGGLEGDEYS